LHFAFSTLSEDDTDGSTLVSSNALLSCSVEPSKRRVQCIYVSKYAQLSEFAVQVC
jgi:hypothetical protein